MAIKVALAAALLVALVALAGATTYTTTVTTTSIDDEANPGRQCSQQLQGRQFRSCQRFLSQRGSQYEEEDEVLEMATGNPGQQQQAQQECCRQLREVDQQGCGCEAIRHAVREVQQSGHGSQQRGQSEQVYEKARQLPRICNLRSQQCQFHVVFV